MTGFNEPNNFVRQKSDKFSGETLTETLSNSFIRLCHQSSAKGDCIYFYIEYSCNGNPKFVNVKQPRLDQGVLFVLLNGNKRYSLRPQVVQSPSYRKEETFLNYVGRCETIYWTEYMAYELSENILHEMAIATTIELELTGGTVSRVLRANENELSFSIMAKALYNAVFDKSLFLEELQVEQKRVDEARKIQKEWKELETLCEEHNHKMGTIIGKKQCDRYTSVEEIIRKFGDYKSELYKHLNFCIPLYKKLYSHMHEYNIAFPNENISVRYGSYQEEEIRLNIQNLEEVRVQVHSSLVIKRVIIAASIVVGVILLFVLFS